MSADIVLDIRDVSVKYGRRTIFENVSLQLRQNEFVTIVGDNGAGKTTLTDAIFGNLTPVRGDILFWGEQLKHNSAKVLNRTARVIAETEIVGPYVTVKQFLELWSRTRSRWDAALAAKLVASFRLDDSKYMSHLSLGEHTKVKLTKALASRPDLLILDELTANLSPVSKDVVLKTLIELFSENKMSVLYISHALDEATRLSDRVVELTSKGLAEVSYEK